MSDVAMGLAAYRNYCDMWRNVGACDRENSVFRVEDRPDMLLIRSRNVERVPHMVLEPNVFPGGARAWTEALVREWSGDPVSLMVGIEPGSERGELTAVLH